MADDHPSRLSIVTFWTVSAVAAALLLVGALPVAAHHAPSEADYVVGGRLHPASSIVPGNVVPGGIVVCQAPPNPLLPLPFGVGGACELADPDGFDAGWRVIDVFNTEGEAVSYLWRPTWPNGTWCLPDYQEAKGRTQLWLDPGCYHITVWVDPLGGVGGTVRVS